MHAPGHAHALDHDHGHEPAPGAWLAALNASGLRQTQQRRALGQLLFEPGGVPRNRHVSAEALFAEARAAGLRVSLATIYNTLNQFTRAGLLRELMVEPGRSYFDTNLGAHHHFFMERSGTLVDIDDAAMQVGPIPAPPPGARIQSVDVIIRVIEDGSGAPGAGAHH